MLNSSNTSPILYGDNILNYFIDDLNPNSKQEDHPTNYYSTSYYHSPSPLLYSEIDYIDGFVSNPDLELIPKSLLPNNSSIHTEDSSILDVDHDKVVDSNKGDEINGIVEDGEVNHHSTISSTKNGASQGGLKKRKRSCNKDRHSKIRTAHGLRDRRMRLSLQVARPFFKLQDMLGYDKASRTVEWLLIQSRSAIEELLLSKDGSPSGVTKCTISSTSEDCEVESTIVQEKKGNPKEKRGSTCAKKDEPKLMRKRTTKEKRMMARERAKKRTLERLQSRVQVKEASNNFVVVREDQHGVDDTNLTGNWNPLTTLSYQQSFEVCQRVPSYTNSTQLNMVGGPQQ